MLHTNNYVFPPIEKNLSYHRSWPYEDCRPFANTIVDVLNRFDIHSELSDYLQGPTLTRFFITPLGKTKVNSIIRLENDFRIALNSPGASVHIEDGKLVIDVPRLQRETVYFGDLVRSDSFKSAPKTALAIGMDIESNTVVYDLRKAVHILIAGQTGSGKSVLMHNIVASLLMKNEPSDLHMHIIDPKILEFSRYSPLPHCTITTEVMSAEKLLNNLCIEMDKRYAILAESGSRDIDSYNKKNADSPMRREVVIIDELADLMNQCGKSVEMSIARLAQKARACGIHLIVATQYPVRNIVTGTIKQNIPTRICLSVSSSVASKVALDVTGGEDLIGNGDMLFLANGSLKPIRLQGGYISEVGIDNIVNFLLYNNNLEQHTPAEINNSSTSSQALKSKNDKSMVCGVASIICGVLGILMWPFSIIGIAIGVSGLECGHEKVIPLIVGLILCIAPHVIRYLPYLPVIF